jgi:VanZ family protein
MFVQKEMPVKPLKFVPAFIWAIIIIVLLVMPSQDIPSNPIFDKIYFDKWVHAGLFGMMNLLLAPPLFKTKYSSIKIYLCNTLCVIAFGVAMEYVQKYLTTDRDFDVLDMVADGIGAVIIFIWVYTGYKKQRIA